MSSRREHPTHTTGAHRAHRRAQHPAPAAPRQPPARYEPYLDGLFTYCLSVLCEHDAATAALGEVLAFAERRKGRGPADARRLRPWLYALARWSCRRALARRHRPVGTPGHAEQGPVPAEERRRELAALAWPEAAGTAPAQREALELSARHQLPTDEIAEVLGLEQEETRTLLAGAACEVERTRAALTVVQHGACPVVARLTGDEQVLLGPALRRELVRHVDDCAGCRRVAERATAGGPWPGSASAPGLLPVLAAPRAEVHAVMLSVQRTGPAGGGPGPRFDRSGFPVDPKDHAARRRRIGSRAMTSAVVATVVAAPVLALWATYRGAPLTGETEGSNPVTASDTDGLRDRHYENAGNAEVGPHPGFGDASGAPDVSVEVVDGEGRKGSGPPRAGHPDEDGRPSPSRGPGRITVAAHPRGDTTVIILTASGGSPVSWSAVAGAPWLRLSQSAGRLRPGDSVTITVTVDHGREPEGPWRARVSIAPGGVTISIEGRGAQPSPTPTEPSPSPSDPSPTPTPTPTGPGPEPSDSAPPESATPSGS
ncbi:BACON domain-containing protein [Streptomyces meridianus]|uniref:Sigma-70 family RNA polymerase sigma factor n=1 Tax=Streptomyces meridianus TaxID=2938945 RepID=A0ABT0XCX7_9ACTN|nr:sigma-70 family RNA polymerase sigma factor [Streptomyces meridianus]MCM2580374.1 sigma-70 family RNA polymerase sigma factor [Streptomyces meridianus]